MLRAAAERVLAQLGRCSRGIRTQEGLRQPKLTYGRRYGYVAAGRDEVLPISARFELDAHSLKSLIPRYIPSLSPLRG